MKKNDLPEEVKMISYVRATDWDGDDAVSAVSMSTYGYLQEGGY